MRCPHCKAENHSKVLKTSQYPSFIRRVRECQRCKKPFVTIEQIQK